MQGQPASISVASMRLLLRRSRPLLPLCAVGVVGAALGAGCGGRVDDDLYRVPPRVVSVSPARPVVPVTTSFEVTFSEVIDPASVDEDPASETVTVVLAPRAVVTDTFLSDLRNPPLVESRQGDCIPLDARVRGDRLDLEPEVVLQPRTAYTLLISSRVRDPAGNPIVDGFGLANVFRYDFETDAGAPAVAGTDLGTALVAPNRRRVAVTFNQPVRNVGETTVSFSPPVSLEAVLLDESRTVATIFIEAPDVGCERFTPATTYTLALSDGIVADTGQALLPFSAEFTTGAACDTTPHTLVGAPSAVAGEVSATVAFSTNKASTTLVRYGLDGGDLDCLGAPCPVLGAPVRTPVSGSAPLAFAHAVAIDGLTVGLTWRAVVSAEDDVGNVASASLTFVTEPLPKLSVNEVMVDPDGTENQGEFIELVNFGDVDLDVSGWRVEVTGNSSCSATLPTPTVVPPGAFLLVVGGAFLPATYGLADDTPMARSSGNNICGSGLLNDGVQVTVFEPTGRPITSMGKHVRPAAGRSTERTSPEAVDVAASFCLSRRDVGPTPGRQNGVTIQGCE
jgi:hypothetical protein